MYKYSWMGLDLLFPPNCGGCGVFRSRWCENCQKTVQRLPNRVCDRCGRPNYKYSACHNCKLRNPSFDKLRSWAYFEGPLRSVIHKLKYRGDQTLGEILARPLIKLLEGYHWNPDTVIPVPLCEKRYLKRGYNQAALLARPVALAIGKPYQTKGLLKIRETDTQVGLTFNQRMVNVSGAFLADSDYVERKRVLLIDDVTTSGATLEACAAALKTAGAMEVFCLTLARSRHFTVN